MPEEQQYVTVHLTRLDLVEDNYACRLCQRREAEAFTDPWLRATGDEEFDFWDLGHELAKDKEDC